MSKYLSQEDVDYLFWKDENGIAIDPSEYRLLELHLNEMKGGNVAPATTRTSITKIGSGK